MASEPLDTLVFAEFRLEADGRLLRAGRAIPLAPKEATLLRVLAGAQGRVVAKDELLDRVWPCEPVSETSLTRSVYLLRNALGDHSRRGGLVETVQGRGYRFCQAVRRLPAAPPTGALRVAVLPFEEPGDLEGRYLGEGIAAAVTRSLGRFAGDGIAPLAPHSARGLQRKGEDALRLARELTLDFLVTGQLRAKEGALEVQVEIVRANDAVLLESQSFSSSEDAAERLAAEIAEALRRRLLGAPAAVASASPPMDPRAWRALLKAEFASDPRTERGIRQGIECCEQAIEWDPGCATAHAAWALGHLFLGMRGIEPPRAIAARVRPALARALALDDDCVRALEGMAQLRWAIDWKPMAALELIRRARELAPNDDSVALRSGMVLCSLGRFEEGLAELERAARLNPLSAIVPITWGQQLVSAGRTEDAFALGRQLVRSEPEYAYGQALLACAAGLLGETRTALRAAETADRLARGDLPARAACAWAFALSGREEAARAIRAAMLRTADRRHAGATFVATVHAVLGEHEAALDQLDRALAQRCMALPFAGSDRRFAPLRENPRFRAVVRQVRGDATG